MSTAPVHTDRAATLRRVRALAAALSLAAAPGCAAPQHPGVSLKVVRAQGAPKDAAVTIDEQYLGPLTFVAAHGVRMPPGTHHMTVERDGYFPLDVTIVARDAPVTVDVALVRVPE